MKQKHRQTAVFLFHGEDLRDLNDPFRQSGGLSGGGFHAGAT